MRQCGICLLITFLFFFIPATDAQNIEKLIEEADFILTKEDFPLAYQKYEYIHILRPEVKKIDYHKEIAFHLSHGRGAPIETLLTFEATKGHTDKFYNYWLGRIYFTRYEFRKAKEHFLAFLQIPAYKSKEIIQETKDFISWIDRAVASYDDPDYYEIEPIPAPVNSPFADISPAFFSGHDELLFASSRSAGSHFEAGDYKIFHSVKTGDQWTEPAFIKEFGVFSQSTAKVEVVDQDGKAFIFKDKGGGDLFYSTPTATGWTKMAEFDSRVKKSLIESHFFISDQEDHIIFASDKLMTGLDLYESYHDLATGEWTAPKAIAGEVNGDFDEDSPYLSHDGKFMYFSSNRPGGVGGLDIYKSRYNPETKSWGMPENLGFPINTIDDELNFVLNTDNKTGYFCSNRLHGQGDYDIYYFHEIQKLVTKGTVYDLKTGDPLAGITVKFHPERYYDESFTAVTDGNGLYELQVIAKETFNVEVEYDGEIIHRTTFRSVTEDFYTPLIRDLRVMQPASHAHTDLAGLFTGESKEEVSSLEMLGSKFRVSRRAVINTIYFAFGSDEIIEDENQSVRQIYEVLMEYPQIQVEIGGHTDDVGAAAFNLDLSRKRAKKIVSMLMEWGIARERLRPVGYGESQPMASNDDEVNGRELNRRIEVKIIEEESDELISNRLKEYHLHTSP